MFIVYLLGLQDLSKATFLEISNGTFLFLGLFLILTILGIHDFGHPENTDGIAPFINSGFFNGI